LPELALLPFHPWRFTRALPLRRASTTVSKVPDL
jgi:hypothetical protein